MQQPAHQPHAEIRRRLASAVGKTALDAAWAAYEEARIAGLCHEGAWEAALGAARRRDREPPTP